MNHTSKRLQLLDVVHVTPPNSDDFYAIVWWAGQNEAHVLPLDNDRQIKSGGRMVVVASWCSVIHAKLVIKNRKWSIE